MLAATFLHLLDYNTNPFPIIKETTRTPPVPATTAASTKLHDTRRLWDARSSRCLGTVKASAQLLFLTWKPDGSELMFLDKTDTLSVVDTRTMKVARTHSYSFEVAPSPPPLDLTRGGIIAFASIWPIPGICLS